MASTESPPGDGLPAGAVIRTCVGCRRRDLVTALLRVVADRGTNTGESVPVLPDPRRVAAGRGAWLHPDPACVTAAERRRAYGRALRLGAAVDAEPVRRYVESTDLRRLPPTEPSRK